MSGFRARRPVVLGWAYRPLESEVMKDLSDKNFGLLIAYVVPGTIVLVGLAAFSPAVRSWLVNSSPAGPTVGGFLFVTLASVAAGMTASAVRWATVDRLHHRTGVLKPAWDDSNLPERLEAFEAIVEAHYRYYQFHSLCGAPHKLCYAHLRIMLSRKLLRC
jgi:hypothetical protein